jgi:hypothetical protein
MEIPIACVRGELGEEERERHRRLMADLRLQMQEVRELPEGLSFRFPAEAIASVAELMGIERRCCPFLELRLEARASEPHVWLTLEGPPGTKDVLKAELQLMSASR